MEFRVATNRDAEGIQAVRDTLALQDNTLEEDGFLIQSTVDEIRDILKQGVVCVSLEQEKIVGYISCFNTKSEWFHKLLSVPSSLTWNDKNPLELKELYYIDSLAVLPEYRSNGTAFKLYSHLFNEIGNVNFLAAVVEKPFQNLRSAKVISRFGFTRIGQFQAARLYGFDNFQSGIYLKRRL